ncbi:MAG TPA: Hsp20/alpha crystallin family protein [Burkholderiales bacterium]
MAKRGNEVTVAKGRLERLPRAVSAFTDLERLFDDFFGRRWLRPFGWERPFGDFFDAGPNVDVIDRDDEVVVRAELPGYRKEDVEVSVSGNTLTLSGETRREEREEKGSYYRAEIARGAFSRTLALPAEVDDAKARASMKDGVLELTLPKVERARRRSITIE